MDTYQQPHRRASCAVHCGDAKQAAEAAEAAEAASASTQLPHRWDAPLHKPRQSIKRHWHYWAIVDDGRGRVATRSKGFASRTACYAAMHREVRDKALHLGAKPCKRNCRLNGREYSR